MGRIGKSLILILILMMTVSTIILTYSTPFGLAQSGTFVAGTVYSNITWTQTKSPYFLSGPLTVSTGVTLTIEPGVIVFLRTYNMQIDGTLVAIGTSSNMIQFAAGQITFTSLSYGWNKQTDAGSQFSYVNLNSTSIQSSVPLKITYCQANSAIQMGGDSEIIDSSTSNTVTVTGSCTVSGNWMSAPNNDPAISISGGSSQVSNNQVTGGGTIYYYVPSFASVIVGAIQIKQGIATVSKNTVNGPITAGNSSIVTNNIVQGTIVASDGSPTISNNTVKGGIYADSDQAPIITQNTVVGFISVNDGSPQIIGNSVSGNGLNFGVGVQTSYDNGNVLIADNYVTNCCYGGAFWSSVGNATFQYNQITNCVYGLTITGGTVAITDNTLQNNTCGISLQNSITIQALNNNNIVRNHTNIYLNNYTANVDAANNWWGTTDQQAINQTIYDFFNNYALGIVNFVPFLTAPNLNATPNLTLPLSTPNTSSSNPTATPTGSSATSSSTPSQSPPSLTSQQSSVSLPTVLVAAVVITVIIAVAVAAFMLGKRAGKKTTPSSERSS